MKTLALVLAGPMIFAQSASALDVFNDYSQVVGNTATVVIPAPASNTFRTRLVAIDTNIQSGSTTTVTIWCAWGDPVANPSTAAVIGSYGFALNVGFDDTGIVNNKPLNCIQTSGGTQHRARLEAYTQQ